MLLAINLMYDRKILIVFALIILVSIINTKICILPVSNFTFLLVSLSLWFISVGATFFCLHKLLQKKEPLQFFSTNKAVKQLKQKRQIKPNPEKVQHLTRDIDQYFISKWYINISKNEDFTEQSRKLLEEIISRLAEVQISVNNKLLLHGSLNLLLRHFKEFRRSLRRKEKYGGRIEELYRYSHMCSNGSNKAKDYFLHQLTTNLLRHFINSELWNSLPCSILVSVLSKKLTSYFLKLASHPDILNYILLNSVASEAVKDEYNLQCYARVSITQYFDVVDSSLEKSKQKLLKNHKTVNEEIQKDVLGGEIGDLEMESTKDEQPVDVNKEKKVSENAQEVLETMKSIDVFKNKSDPKEKKPESSDAKLPILYRSQPSDTVKIYEQKITKCNKTWRDSKDLGLGISLGQDPLDITLPVAMENIKHFGKSTFWDTGKIEHFVEDSSAQIISEVKHTTQTTMEGLKSSIKPISDATVHTLHNIKDLQETTVNSALHKIGDFQDEAASMVEGIFDLGKAGLRKGLRLTGLQDNIENAKASLGVSASQPKTLSKKKATKTYGKVETPENSVLADECIDTVWMNPLTMDSPNFDGQILLEKPCEKVQKMEEKEERALQIPFISMEEPHISGYNSPDPEYEDAADLASSIAKLRSLLQQRSSESSMSTPALSPMFVQAKYQGLRKIAVADKVPFCGSRPPEDFGQKTGETESISDTDEVDGVMPSFYKFCAKTATGVLDKTIHTIKTALPGSAQGVGQNDNAWIFVQTDQTEADILTRMKKLLTERKEYCTLDSEIDTAYEAIDSLDAFQHTSFPSNVEFEDELDDFEVKLPISKSLMDIFCELLADTDTPFIQEPVIKAVLLTLGNTIENFVMSTFDAAMENFCENLLTIPEKSNQNTLNMDLDMYVELIMSSLPDLLKLTFGKNTLSKALALLVSSLQIQNINEDVVLQLFELVSMKLIEESNQLSPPASA